MSGLPWRLRQVAPDFAHQLSVLIRSLPARGIAFDVLDCAIRPGW